MAVVKCLLEHGADVNIGLPIVSAVKRRWYEAALLMLEYCKEIVDKEKHEDAMFLAIADGRMDVAKRLAGFLPKTESSMKKAEEFLRQLALNGNVIAIQRLIEMMNVDVNCKDQKNDTPLFYAMDGGKLDAAMYLIKHGADIKVLGSGDETLLHCAAMEDLEFVKYLVEHGLDVNAKNKAGVTPLHHAVCCGQIDIAAYLLEHGADIHVTATDGKPLVYCASLKGTEEMLKFLVERGLDFKAKTKDGFTPMHAAVAVNPAIIPYLRSIGFPELSEEDVKKAKNKYYSSLHLHDAFTIGCGHFWNHGNIVYYM